MISQVVFGRGKKRIVVNIYPDMRLEMSSFIKGQLFGGYNGQPVRSVAA